MIVLDTNVVSESLVPNGDQAVLNWLDRQPATDLFLSVVTAAELTYGVLRLPPGRRRAALQAEVDITIVQDFAARLVPYGLAAARACSSIMAQRERLGRPVQIADAQIAGTCLAQGAILATRNTGDFEGTGVELVNPWDQG